MTQNHTIIVEEFRGTIVENRHRVSAVVVDGSGGPVAYSGDPHLVTFMRSAAKPFQLMPLLTSGAAEEFGVSDREVALSCASHNSEREQVELVSDYLRRVGFEPSDLACGPHRSLFRDLGLPEAPDPKPEIVPPSPVASNCSGKHTAMLAFCRYHGLESEGYHRARHPAQQRYIEEMSRWSDTRIQDIGSAVDGCGVLTLALPLAAMARAYQRLGSETEPEPQRIVRAMTEHPELVAGARRLCTAIMRALPGEVVAKVGAGGLYLAALPRLELGVAVKVESGHARSAEVALLRVLDNLGIEVDVAELEPYRHPGVLNTRRERVGELRVAGELSRV